MKKSNKGFTLVELIVVIAIIGILAAILVPAMISYITDSKISSANSTCKTVYNAINNYAQKCVTKETAIADGIYYVVAAETESGTDVTSVPAAWDANITPVTKLADAVHKGVGKEADGSYTEVAFSNGFPVAAIWCAKDQCSATPTNGTQATLKTKAYVGGYPKQADTTNWDLTKAGYTPASTTAAP